MAVIGAASRFADHAFERRIRLLDHDVAEPEPTGRAPGHLCVRGHLRRHSAPSVTPTTTKGRLAATASAESGDWCASVELDEHGPPTFGCDSAAQLVEEGAGAEVLEDRETLPCAFSEGRCRRRTLGRQRRHGADRDIRSILSARPPASSEASNELGRTFPGLDTLALLGERAALMGLWRRGRHQLRRVVPAGAGRPRGGWPSRCLGPRTSRLSRPGWSSSTRPRPLPPLVRRGGGGDGPGPGRAAGAGRAARSSGVPGGRGDGPRGRRRRAGRCDIGRCGASRRPRPPRGRSLVPLGRPALRRSARRGRGHRGQGRVHGETRRRETGAGGVLRPSQRAQALGRTRLRVGRRRPHARGPGAPGRRRDRGQPAPRPGAARDRGGRGRRGGGPRVWVSITAYGRTEGLRVGFGDDAACAGGLVVWHGGEPMFCADAVADPISGLTAAAACLDALARGGRWLLDVSMSGVCAAMAGPTLPAAPRIGGGPAPGPSGAGTRAIARVGHGGCPGRARPAMKGGRHDRADLAEAPAATRVVLIGRPVQLAPGFAFSPSKRPAGRTER